MAQATFVQNATLAKRSGIAYISADVKDVSVKAITGSVANSSYSGINGTFFEKGSGVLLGMAVGKSGLPVKQDGSGARNGHPIDDERTRKRGTFFCYNPEGDSTGITCNEQVVTYPSGSTLIKPIWINWAIGGLSLFLNQNLTPDAYYKKVDDVEQPGSIGYFGIAESNRRSRSVIGYKPSNKRIILAYIPNALPHECRNVLATLGCTAGVMLDSGSSSQIKGKVAGSASAINIGSSVSVYNMVAVTPTSWA